MKKNIDEDIPEGSMDSSGQSPPHDNSDTKSAFRKPSNDAGNRKYRRRSPESGSSSAGGSPKRDRSFSPAPLREDAANVSDRRRKDDGRAMDRDSGRSQYGQSGDSYRHSDRHSSGSSHGYLRHEKYAADDDRGYYRSSRSGRNSRSGNYSDYARQETEHRSDHSRNADKYSRDKADYAGHRSRDKDTESRRHSNSSVEETKYVGRDIKNRDVRDEKREYHRSLKDYKGDRISHEESRGHRNDSTLERDGGGHRHRMESKELDDEKHAKEDKKRNDELESYKDRYDKETREHYRGEDSSVSESQESAAKRPKLFDSGDNSDHTKYGGKQSEEVVKTIPEPPPLSNPDAASDINAAKVAAMKAAELVNKNLVGVGYMSADQKKKLLWGNRKNNAQEESGHHWDTALSFDHERQEKFNKLMILRLPWYLWPIVGCEGRRKNGAQIRESRRERSYTGGEAEGTPVGFGEAVHCWSSKKRWSNCWTGSLKMFRLGSYCTLIVFVLYLFGTSDPTRV
ncbi:hypothetical protein RJ641_025564 [Dillenia turbinata]|uniref:Arginine/serine-rich coiled-coil protein 2 n=1 Tax=Dillenia turbinata TaxID=194707 RepID=A0AAN8ZP27_9MAGN